MVGLCYVFIGWNGLDGGECYYFDCGIDLCGELGVCLCCVGIFVGVDGFDGFWRSFVGYVGVVFGSG